MDPNNTVCPVCTLFLRPGITLKQHLTSHPKHKVIEALVKLAEDTNKESVPSATLDPNKPTNSAQVNTAVANGTWQPPQPAAVPSTSQVHPVHGNHLFIYQQSMSTTSPQTNMMNVNPISQHYVYPTVFNPQIMPYVYQQQQVILSSNSLPPPMRALPFELPNSTTSNSIDVKKSSGNDEGRIVEVQDDSGVDTTMETESSKEEGEDCESTTKKDLVHEEEDDEDDEEEEETLHSEYNEVTIKENHVDQFYKPVHHEDCVESPKSHSNMEWGLNTELNKACQTQNICSSPSRSQIIEEQVQIEPQKDRPDYFYMDQQNQYSVRSDCYQDPVTSVPFTTIKLNDTYEQSEPIYTSANILHGNDHLEFVTMDDIVIVNDFTPSNHQVVSQVENFEITSPDRSGVLMTIGEVAEPPKMDFNDQHDLEESMSRGSSHVNIRSDERMPATGELSGQESIGDASDITWNRLQYHQEGHSRIFQSYDLIGKNSWEMSDSESVDNPEMPKKIPVSINEEANDDDAPTIIGFSGPPLNFKCPICGEGFANSKERRIHETKKHPEKKRSNVIGCDIDKKKVKKLVVKCKTDKDKEKEQNFDNIFTNKLKLENADGPAQDTTVIKVDDAPLPIDPQNLKAVCPICDCVLENSRALRKHKNDIHKEITSSKHKCITCGECFKNEYKYNEHLKIHPLECRLCGRLFYRKQNIQLHMKRHLGLKPYKCEICQKCFVTRQKHDEHKNVHTGDTPLKCNMCDEKFRRHSNLVQHRNRHHLQMKKKVRDYICQCGEIFHSKKKLAWHKEIHEAKPKACAHCSEKFLHMSSLTRHMRRAHNGKFLPEETRQNENVECPICKGTFLRSSLDVHIKNHSGQRPYTCLICNKDFTTKWNLKLHKWTHASRTSKPYKCDQCKGAFIRETDYIAHMNSHKSVRPYTCNYCGAQFIRKYNCLRHVKEHESKKNFNCQVCGKSFHRSYYLKDHMRVHSGIRPYACHICGKTSSTKSNHNKHVQIHHAREPVSTEN
nr:unnamed protein product [Callosobruchus analis]